MSFQTYTQNISAKSILKYALLPDFKSRFRDLGLSLSWFVMFFASFFNTAGLIENNHPCLRAENVGRYGFKEVIGIAYRNIKWQRAYIPQILMFFAVIASIVMSIVLICTTLFYYLITYAHAQGSTISIFSTDPNADMPQPQQHEYALQFLAKVFGDTGIGAFAPSAQYCADNGGGGSCDYTYSWLTLALQEMLSIYSNAMMIIGGFIVLYYIVTVLVESAQTGKPLGGRFSVWAPARLAIAIMFLVPAPFAGGYNGAQLVIFQAISWGSNLATNIWVTGLNQFLNSNSCNINSDDDGNCLVGIPPRTNNAEFVRGLFLIEACRAAFNLEMKRAGKSPDWYYEDGSDYSGGDDGHAYAVSDTYIGVRLIENAANGSTTVVYGNKEDADYCGAIKLPWPRDIASQGVLSRGAVNYLSWGGHRGDPVGSGTLTVQYHFNDPSNRIKEGYMSAYFATMYDGENIPKVTQELTEILIAGGGKNDDVLYSDEKKSQRYILNWLGQFAQIQEDYFINAAQMQNEIARAVIPEGAEGGWANAGAFYLTLANLNGGIQSAASDAPAILNMPVILSNPHATPHGVDEDNDDYVNVHDALKRMSLWWNNYPAQAGTAAEVDSYGFGQLQAASPDDSTGKAGSIDANSALSFFTGPLGSALVISNTMNPLGQLMALGASITTISLIAIIAGAVLTNGWLVPGLGYFIMTVGGLFLATGILLYIILPMLPFFYFTFGVVNWVIAVFEAIVGAPLWALSFLKIDGPGLPAGGMNGIYLIFLLFLHPTLMIFGLVGSILMFSAAVGFVNVTFNIVMETVMADRSSGGFSALAFIIMYVIIVYMVGESCFKMIDTIPKKIVRFMGKGGADPYTEMADVKGLEGKTLIMAGMMSKAAGGATKMRAPKFGGGDKKNKNKDDDGVESGE